MVIQIGMAECNQPRTVLYNSAVVIGPNGVIGSYRKVHNYRELPIFRSGTTFPVFDTPVGRIGAFICADLNYPECLRALAIQGAQILTMTTAWPMESDNPEMDYLGHMYNVQMEAAAIANQVWIAAANQVRRPPKEGAANYYGHSRIVSPFGLTVAGCGYEETLVVANVDLLGEIRKDKYSWGDRIQQRRPELYGILSDPQY
jgi:predicted amidohydrolase